MQSAKCKMKNGERRLRGMRLGAAVGGVQCLVQFSVFSFQCSVRKGRVAVGKR